METLLIERDAELPGLVTITLNRPEKLNAINVTMHDELQQVCRELQDDIDARVVIITGAGRAFSSGAELTSTRPGQPRSDLDRRYPPQRPSGSRGRSPGRAQISLGEIGRAHV